MEARGCNVSRKIPLKSDFGKTYRLSLVIPAVNEEESILQAIEEAIDALARTTGDFEILVIDDGSTDRTAEIVQTAAHTNARLRLIRQPCNMGYGAALRVGFQA